MHVGRLISTLNIINSDFSNHGVSTALEGLLNLYSQSNLVEDTAFKLLCVLRVFLLIKTIEKSNTNNCTPTQNVIIKELRADNFTGKFLLSRVLRILESDSTIKGEQFQDLVIEYREFQKTITELFYSLTKFDLESCDLSPEESEIGVRFSGSDIKNNITTFEKELHQLSFAIKAFGELIDEDYSDIKIRTISTSDITIWLECGAAISAALAIAIERIVALYKSMLEIRKLKAELSKQDVPEEVISILREHLDNLLDGKLEALANEIVNEHWNNKADNGRKNELIISTKRALKYISRRMASGTVFEASFGEKALDNRKNNKTRVSSESKNTLSIEEILNKAGRSNEELNALDAETKELLTHHVNDNELED